MSESISYLSGFGNHFESEAIASALVKGRNSPQKVPFGLYAEQLSGSAFTRATSSQFTYLVISYSSFGTRMTNFYQLPILI